MLASSSRFSQWTGPFVPSPTLRRHAYLPPSCMPSSFVYLHSSILLSLDILNIASDTPTTVIMKSTVFWNVTPYDFANTHHCFGGHFHYSVLKIQTAVSSEKLIVIQIIQSHVSQKCVIQYQLRNIFLCNQLTNFIVQSPSSVLYLLLLARHVLRFM